MNIEIGLDIATSVSIIGAAISFWISQNKLRKQNINIFVLENLKEALNLIEANAVEFNLKVSDVVYSGKKETVNKEIKKMHQDFRNLKDKLEVKKNILDAVCNEKELQALCDMLKGIDNILEIKPDKFAKSIENIKKQLDSNISGFTSVLKLRL